MRWCAGGQHQKPSFPFVTHCRIRRFTYAFASSANTCTPKSTTRHPSALTGRVDSRNWYLLKVADGKRTAGWSCSDPPSWLTHCTAALLGCRGCVSRCFLVIGRASAPPSFPPPQRAVFALPRLRFGVGRFSQFT